ncbi:MAG: DUF1453 domain-containing protein, partial [Opitutaceae bacterium]
LMLEATIGGLLAGGLLAMVALRLTKFETSQAKPHYYTPNTYIGLGLTLLLAGRVIYRVGVLYFSKTATTLTAPTVMHSPLTMVILGLTAGYYVVFNSGVLLKSRRRSSAFGKRV